MTEESPETEHPTPLRDVLSRRWADIEDAARTMVGGSRETIRPDAPGGTESAHARALQALLAHNSISSDASRVRTHDVLGMGGMGVVHVGTQASLDRSVAVKSVRPDLRDPVNTLKLLQEAWIAGRLEHPNIVPVYDIGADPSGEPLIVLQKIEGQSWDTLTADADDVHTRFGAADLLDWNLRVLMQVCNAIHYAHSRSIVHLDVKPSNVMIGAFGEVLILDWGLAMSLQDDGTGRLPLAADNEEIVGTPSYMAPEMLAQEGGRLDERTDVYLLGATLYELCAGHPPHQGPNMLAILYAIATDELAPPTGVPDELAAICMRAMAMDPADRYASAEELRLALQDFLEHRGSLQLAAEAARKADLVVAMARQGREPDDLRELYEGARFGFEQALHAWPENPKAQEGLRCLHVHRCRYALHQGNAAQAAELMAALDDPPADLVAAVQQALADEQGRTARLTQLQAFRDDMDVRIGQRTRVFLVGLLGLGWTTVPVLRHLSPPAAPDEHFSGFIIVPSLFLVLFLGLLLWARDSMTRTAINRRTAWSVITLLLFQIVMTAITWSMGLEPTQMMTVNFVLWSLCATMFTIAVDRRTLPMTLGFVAGLAGAVAFPHVIYLLMSAACFGMTLNALVIWWPRPFFRPKPPPSAGSA